jgi:hypothetical protein
VRKQRHSQGDGLSAGVAGVILVKTDSHAAAVLRDGHSAGLAVQPLGTATRTIITTLQHRIPLPSSFSGC